jgi:UDP-glucose 4-epimerase
MKKNVLITGVAGFMGSNLADEFIKRGYSVIGIDNLIGGYKENVPEGVKFYEADLGNFDEVKDLFNGVDLVVHTACTAYEGLSVFSPALVTRNTSHITTVALSASVRAGVRKFVHMSSMARYGTQDTVPFTEDMTPKPQDPYGIAKYAAELLIKNICDTQGMEYVILVPHNIIGPRQKYDDPFRNVASIMINRMLQGKQPIIYGDGSQMRCFSFMQDVTDPLMIACETDVANGKIINIGPDEEFVTINELATAPEPEKPGIKELLTQLKTAIENKDKNSCIEIYNSIPGTGFVYFIDEIVENRLGRIEGALLKFNFED